VTQAQRKQLEKRLHQLRDQLSGKGAARIDPNRLSEAEIGTKEDEQPLNEMLQSIASNRNRNDADIIRRIDLALKKLRIEPDDFGLCEECQDDIPFARLKLMPYAEFCVGCQAKRDPPKSTTRKKLTDYT
jgi:DnaK suppressor protein